MCIFVFGRIALMKCISVSNIAHTYTHTCINGDVKGQDRKKKKCRTKTEIYSGQLPSLTSQITITNRFCGGVLTVFSAFATWWKRGKRNVFIIKRNKKSIAINFILPTLECHLLIARAHTQPKTFDAKLLQMCQFERFFFCGCCCCFRNILIISPDSIVNSFVWVRVAISFSRSSSDHISVIFTFSNRKY